AKGLLRLIVLALVVKKFAEVSQHLELIRISREQAPHLFLRLFGTTLIKVHAGVHPVNTRSGWIEFDAAVVGIFCQVQHSTVVIKVPNKIPCGLGVGSHSDRLSQGLERLEIVTHLCQCSSQSYDGFGRIGFQGDSFASGFLAENKVFWSMLGYVGSLHHVERREQ